MDYVFAFRMHETVVGGGGFPPAFGHAEELVDASRFQEVAAYRGGGIVGAVVDDYYLEIVVGLFVERFQKTVDVRAFILAGDKD